MRFYWYPGERGGPARGVPRGGHRRAAPHAGEGLPDGAEGRSSVQRRGEPGPPEGGAAEKEWQRAGTQHRREEVSLKEEEKDIHTDRQHFVCVTSTTQHNKEILQ